MDLGFLLAFAQNSPSERPGEAQPAADTVGEPTSATSDYPRNGRSASMVHLSDRPYGRRDSNQGDR
jgi:hypothetical protein